MSSTLDNPHAVIVCNDLERYTPFAELLVKNGFPCRAVQNFPEEETQDGTIYFVSFNLLSTNAIFLAKKIEGLGMACIVFAEEPGVQTAAKLSSAKMTQTLQHPYTQKNFVMAVQTIVKNRKAQLEKDLRKKQHEERLKAQQKISGPVTNGGVIIQEGAPQVTDDSARVFKGELKDYSSVLQAGQASKGFFVIQEGIKPAASKNYSVAEAAHKAPKNQNQESVVLDYSAMKNKAAHQSDIKTAGAGSSPMAEVIPISVNSQTPPSETGSGAPVVERPMSHFWAVFVMVLLGSMVCLYCVHQILFGL